MKKRKLQSDDKLFLDLLGTFGKTTRKNLGKLDRTTIRRGLRALDTLTAYLRFTLDVRSVQALRAKK